MCGGEEVVRLGCARAALLEELALLSEKRRRDVSGRELLSMRFLVPGLLFAAAGCKYGNTSLGPLKDPKPPDLGPTGLFIDQPKSGETITGSWVGVRPLWSAGFAKQYQPDSRHASSQMGSSWGTYCFARRIGATLRRPQ
jgi:hypothetical protein